MKLPALAVFYYWQDSIRGFLDFIFETSIFSSHISLFHKFLSMYCSPISWWMILSDIWKTRCCRWGVSWPLAPPSAGWTGRPTSDTSSRTGRSMWNTWNSSSVTVPSRSVSCFCHYPGIVCQLLFRRILDFDVMGPWLGILVGWVAGGRVMALIGSFLHCCSVQFSKN